MTASITVRRVYEAPDADGSAYRVLVDRLWPRGMSKESLHYDQWCKTLAPSSELRRWFGHKVENWPGFQEKYTQELQQVEQQQALREVLDAAGSQPIVLLYGARDAEHNQAVVLAGVLQRLRAAR